MEIDVVNRPAASFETEPRLCSYAGRIVAERLCIENVHTRFWELQIMSFRSTTFQNFIHFGKDLGQVRKGHRELRRISGEVLFGKGITVHDLEVRVD